MRFVIGYIELLYTIFICGALMFFCAMAMYGIVAFIVLLLEFFFGERK